MSQTKNPDTSQKNAILTAMLVRWDFCICLCVISWVVLITGPSALLMFPAIVLQIQGRGAGIRWYYRLMKGVRLPTPDEKFAIGRHFKVPAFSYFVFVKHSEPRCISLVIFSVIVLPEGLDVSNPDDNVKFYLSHELSHARFVDLSAVSWVAVTGLMVVVFFLQFGDFAIFQELQSHVTEKGMKDTFSAIFLIYTTPLAALSTFHLRNMMHRQEYSADLNAFKQYPKSAQICLQKEERREKYQKSANIIDRIVSWLTHPNSNSRLSMLSGNLTYSKVNQIFSHFLMGLYFPLILLQAAGIVVFVSEVDLRVKVVIFLIISFVTIYHSNKSLIEYTNLSKLENRWIPSVEIIALCIGVTIIFFPISAIYHDSADYIPLNFSETITFYEILLILMAPSLFMGFALLIAISRLSRQLNHTLRLPLIHLALLSISSGLALLLLAYFTAYGTLSIYPVYAFAVSISAIVITEIITEAFCRISKKITLLGKMVE